MNLDVDKVMKPSDFTLMELEEYGLEHDEPNDSKGNMGLPNTSNPAPNKGWHDDDNLETKLEKVHEVKK